jgi:hypothetical protein
LWALRQHLDFGQNRPLEVCDLWILGIGFRILFRIN